MLDTTMFVQTSGGKYEPNIVLYAKINSKGHPARIVHFWLPLRYSLADIKMKGVPRLFRLSLPAPPSRIEKDGRVFYQFE
jgi:hypothetical protein